MLIFLTTLTPSVFHTYPLYDSMTTGGTLGGITSGQLLVFRVGIKPASSISQDQAGGPS